MYGGWGVVKINNWIFKVERSDALSLNSKHAVYFYHSLAGQQFIEPEEINIDDFFPNNEEVKPSDIKVKEYPRWKFAVEIPEEINHPIFGAFKTSELSDMELIWFAIGSDIAERRNRK